MRIGAIFDDSAKKTGQRSRGREDVGATCLHPSSEIVGGGGMKLMLMQTDKTTKEFDRRREINYKMKTLLFITYAFQ